VTLALRKAERFRTDLVRRGVLLVPVIFGEGRKPKIEKKGFGQKPKGAEALPSIGVRFYITMHLGEPFSSIQNFLFCLMK
jgi:hypothetical protein